MDVVAQEVRRLHQYTRSFSFSRFSSGNAFRQVWQGSNIWSFGLQDRDAPYALLPFETTAGTVQGRFQRLPVPHPGAIAQHQACILTDEVGALTDGQTVPLRPMKAEVWELTITRT